MSASLTSLAYLVAGVLFILALRGLSHPTTSQQGNRFGMIGMAVAAAATLLHHGMSGSGYMLIVLGVAIGGSIGTLIARRIQMTALPQLVAAFHSLVGLAAVFVAAAALNAPEAFGIGTAENIRTESLIEMSLGLAIGAITFSGSLIAFAKLHRTQPLKEEGGSARRYSDDTCLIVLRRAEFAPIDPLLDLNRRPVYCDIPSLNRQDLAWT